MTSILRTAVTCVFLLLHRCGCFVPQPASSQQRQRQHPTASATSCQLNPETSPTKQSSIFITGVTLKIALDQQSGVVDLSETKVERFTSPESLDMVHRLRVDCDAVLVGRNTVEVDDCTLTVRRVPLPSHREQPVRVIVDPKLTLLKHRKEYKIFTDGLPTLVYHAVEYPPSLAEKYPNVTLCYSKPNADTHQLDPKLLIQDLSSRGIHHVMVEGGVATAKSFLQAGTVDRAIVVTAPIKFQQPLLSNMNDEILQTSGLNLVASSMQGVDEVEYWSRPNLQWPADPPCAWP